MKIGWVVAALFVAALAGVYATMNTPLFGQRDSRALVGGPFTLVDSNGKRVTDRDFRGKLMLVFFGYAHCPDICPTELQTLSDVMEKLGPDAEKVAPVFISVDPGRDTPEELSSYMKNFDPRITGLTGEEKDIERVAKAYRVYYRKAAESGANDYSVDHSAFVYFMDGEGKYVTHFPFNVRAGTILTAIKNKIAADKTPERP